ncbi:YqhR family membrane protein [Paenibacillus abyssi]|uniref:Uncharacterized protein n=1 Tax=Paenibacillus abyssi TaxID=1340531 RepID=A0A917FJ40_9BACL|nr:YqhR family membrane protein [Paenibacillus abyssi]GGF86950.1 hypothetical protein GCM10010916_00370 [Paenibacillus abyssi]
MHEKDNLETHAKEYHTNSWLYCLQLGFFAGLIWGVMRWLLYTISFTNVLPGFLAEPFMVHSFLLTGWGHVAGIAVFIVFSIAAALLYKAVLGRLLGPWAGLIYGVTWWLVLFMWLGPMLGMMPPAAKLGWNSVFTECCVFIVWGLFIGYSIAFEFTDEASREPSTVH